MKVGKLSMWPSFVAQDDITTIYKSQYIHPGRLIFSENNGLENVWEMIFTLKTGVFSGSRFNLPGFKSTIHPQKKHTDIHLSLFMSKLPWWWGSKLLWWWASKLPTRAPTPHDSRQILTFWLLFPYCATWHEHDLKDLHEMFGTMKIPKFLPRVMNITGELGWKEPNKHK